MGVRRRFRVRIPGRTPHNVGTDPALWLLIVIDHCNRTADCRSWGLYCCVLLVWGRSSVRLGVRTLLTPSVRYGLSDETSQSHTGMTPTTLYPSFQDITTVVASLSWLDFHSLKAGKLAGLVDNCCHFQKLPKEVVGPKLLRPMQRVAVGLKYWALVKFSKRKLSGIPLPPLRTYLHEPAMQSLLLLLLVRKMNLSRRHLLHEEMPLVCAEHHSTSLPFTSGEIHFAGTGRL
jgi:hypothetical protein